MEAQRCCLGSVDTHASANLACRQWTHVQPRADASALRRGEATHLGVPAPAIASPRTAVHQQHHRKLGRFHSSGQGAQGNHFLAVGRRDDVRCHLDQGVFLQLGPREKEQGAATVCALIEEVSGLDRTDALVRHKARHGAIHGPQYRALPHPQPTPASMSLPIRHPSCRPRSTPCHQSSAT